MTPPSLINSSINSDLLKTLHQVLSESGISHAAAVATAAALTADTLATSHGPIQMKELALLEIQDFMMVRMYQVIKELGESPHDH